MADNTRWLSQLKLSKWIIQWSSFKPIVPWHFLYYCRVSKGTKINHMRSNHIHKSSFQDIVYLKLNKWRDKISKSINKKNTTWCVKLIRKQKKIVSLPHDRMSHQTRENWIIMWKWGNRDLYFWLKERDWASTIFKSQTSDLSRAFGIEFDHMLELLLVLHHGHVTLLHT